MTIQEFIAMDYEGRLNTALRAVCVAGRDESVFKVLLYQLNSFYIEVYYNKIHHYISELKPFDSTDQLDPYLERLAIPV